MSIFNCGIDNDAIVYHKNNTPKSPLVWNDFSLKFVWSIIRKKSQDKIQGIKSGVSHEGILEMLNI
ncbi:11318_t:CDS:2 [Rhizophagus irregularis]|nr:11318_t:CDS:2 [Rhizophagus irregularis]